jgi:hypothetical protein
MHAGVETPCLPRLLQGTHTPAVQSMQEENFKEGTAGGIAPAEGKNLHDQRRWALEVSVYDQAKNLCRAQTLCPTKRRHGRTGKKECLRAINIHQNWRAMMPAAIGDVS